MAKVKIMDVIVPEIFQRYSLERTATVSAFWQSGIVQQAPEFTAIANSEGVSIQMPFWQDLTGDEEVLSDSAPLSVNGIETEKDACGLHNIGKAWSANDLAGMLAGSDPMMAISNLSGDYWARVLQKRLIKSVTGVFAAASMSGSINAINATSGGFTSANYLTGSTFIDTKGKLGDAESKLVAIAMHSDVERSLRKLGLIDDINAADLRSQVSQFQGLRVIVDDGMPTASVNGATAYDTVLFGTGAFAYGEANVAKPIQGGHGDWYVEMGRSHLAGDTDLVQRKRNVLHPRGVRYDYTLQALSTGATQAELANGSAWTRVYEKKNVRLALCRHNIPA